MILDNNLIAYEYYKNQYTFKPVEISGARDENTDKYAFGKNNYAVLVLEEDIINSEGYGLKKGFYNVKTDEYMDFLIIFQSGKIKAKIPITETKVLEAIEPVQFKPKKMSQRKYLKEKQKEYRKYLNGENPENIKIKTAQIHRLDEENSYILIYNTGNLEISGIIRF